MKIETKFNVGDEVLVLEETKLIKKVIHSMKIEIEKNGQISIFYWFMEKKLEDLFFEICQESKCFATKEEFLNQLETGE